MSVNACNTGLRYHVPHISTKIIPVIKELHKTGLIDLVKGSYPGPEAQGNRTTRIRASTALQVWFSQAQFAR